jgi:membrane dipeptidase
MASQQAPPYPARPPVALTEEARRLHQACLVIDGHNDLPWQIYRRAGSALEQIDLAQSQPDFHTDIPRLRRGGLGAQFWAVYVPPSREGSPACCALEQIDLIHRMVRRYPETFDAARCADDIERVSREGRIASLIGIEGGQTIEGSLAVLRMFFALGARYMTLTHGDTTDWCDSGTDESRHGGLTPFGGQVIHEMNRLGMLVDISHASMKAAQDVLRISRAPIIASHSSADAVARHPRNLTDDILERIARNKGLAMVNFYSGYVEPNAAEITRRMFDVARELRAKHPEEQDYRDAYQRWKAEHPIPRGTVHTVIDHIDHIVKVAGIDHVGLGADYDGVGTLPEQLEDVSCYPCITAGLLSRGYDEPSIRKILGGNLLRVMRLAEQVARTEQASDQRRA